MTWKKVAPMAFQSTSTVEAEDVESDLEDLEEHYYSNLRRYSAILDRDRPRHYTTQQFEYARMGLSWWPRWLREVSLSSCHPGPLPGLCFLLET